MHDGEDSVENEAIHHDRQDIWIVYYLRRISSLTKGYVDLHEELENQVSNRIEMLLYCLVPSLRKNTIDDQATRESAVIHLNGRLSILAVSILLQDDASSSSHCPDLNSGVHERERGRGGTENLVHWIIDRYEDERDTPRTVERSPLDPCETLR